MTLLTDHIRFNRILFRDQVFLPDYLSKSVDAFASYLDTHIRSNSPIVYLFAPNHVKTVIAFLGIVKSGRAALLVDPRVGKLEYQEMLADTKPGAIVQINTAPIEFDYDKEIECTDNRMDVKLVSELDDVCVMLYTAAEDGYAKAAMLTNKNLYENAKSISEGNNVDRQSASCALLPFYHLYGFQNGAITPFVAGGTAAIFDILKSQRPTDIAESLYRHSVTHIYSIPIIYYVVQKSPLISDIVKRAYSLISGGYKLPQAIADPYINRYDTYIYEGYGLTEASPVCTWQFKQERYERNSIGRAIKNCQVKIMNETNIEVPFGAKGEICIKGDNVMKGYFNYPEATRNAVINGWLHTGDFGRQDESGNFYFLGLKKKMFNIMGKKAYPEEIRRHMMKNENVETVILESESNEIKGDSLKATIVLKDHTPYSEKEFCNWCKNNLTDHKMPREISFYTCCNAMEETVMK